MDENADFLITNWKSIPKDIKLLLMGKLDDETRYKFCQISNEIATFCRENRLTYYDKVLSLNPDGELIDTINKQVELIQRGFETTFSLIMNEERFRNEEAGVYNSSNIPDVKDIVVKELVFGADHGTNYYYQHGYDTMSFYVHLNMVGLPPTKGVPIKFLFVSMYSFNGHEIEAIHYIDRDDLYEKIYEMSATSEDNIYKQINYDENLFNELVTNKRIVVNGEVAQLYELPCP